MLTEYKLVAEFSIASYHEDSTKQVAREIAEAVRKAVESQPVAVSEGVVKIIRVDN